MPALTPRAELAATFARLHGHFLQTVVPLWEGPGWNAQMQLAYEALGPDLAPAPVQRYRAMACARQLFLFTSLAPREGAAKRATALFKSLGAHFADPAHGGWFYSIDAAGQPLDRSKDLYTHAFIVFATAHYLALTRSPAAGAQLDSALKVIATRFARGDGLYQAALAENWADLGQGPLQNPLMHLAEAFLAVLEARPDTTCEAALVALCDAMLARFIDPEHGVLMEKPSGSAGNWFEPGHQFEWYYLLKASPLLREHPLCAQLENTFSYSERIGVHGGDVLAMLAASGEVKDGTRRIWAQAEYLRALTLRPGADTRVLAQLQRLQGQFLHPGGWYECRDAHGAVSRHDMPSTTPYHLATAYAATQRLRSIANPAHD
ncbi:AGE family epimerase/isomerase [Pseudomonas typographi]|uniref:N-acylglucosamine 2-epimerase n=1 Tax=Pseudomonas typographi TaxID=2715964 RepID=A0ABR7Z5W9_9PSED|nr:AGE family epimerase/isomerase [Pseudomonas typographi]MBD1600758.1 N-acylglucosamine 2-epimerase [Pseudomonas typographi]